MFPAASGRPRGIRLRLPLHATESASCEFLNKACKKNCLIFQNLCPDLAGANHSARRLRETIASGRIAAVIPSRTYCFSAKPHPNRPPPRPYLHQLSSRLPGFAERQGLAALAVTGFLGKLALGGAEGCFALCDQALGDRPRSHLVAPKGAAGMTPQNFNAVAVVPVEEKASALPTRVGSSY